MSKLSKFSVLLFTIVLSYVSISTANDGKPAKLKHHELEEASTSSFFSDKRLNILSLFGSAEHVANPARNFPTPNSKYHPSGSWVGLFSFEVKVQNISLQYLLHSKVIYRSLTIRDIIFPFHYFW